MDLHFQSINLFFVDSLPIGNIGMLPSQTLSSYNFTGKAVSFSFSFEINMIQKCLTLLGGLPIGLGRDKMPFTSIFALKVLGSTLVFNAFFGPWPHWGMGIVQRIVIHTLKKNGIYGIHCPLNSPHFWSSWKFLFLLAISSLRYYLFSDKTYG